MKTKARILILFLLIFATYNSTSATSTNENESTYNLPDLGASESYIVYRTIHYQYYTDFSNIINEVNAKYGKTHVLEVDMIVYKDTSSIAISVTPRYK